METANPTLHRYISTLRASHYLLHLVYNCLLWKLFPNFKLMLRSVRKQLNLISFFSVSCHYMRRSNVKLCLLNMVKLWEVFLPQQTIHPPLYSEANEPQNVNPWKSLVLTVCYYERLQCSSSWFHHWFWGSLEFAFMWMGCWRILEEKKKQGKFAERH